MEVDRKRSRGPEEGGSKRSRLEKSPSTEHEISIHASYDDDLLSSPTSTGGSPALERERSEGRSHSSHSPMPTAVETVPVDQSFPIAKLSRGSSEKRKERRYRGGVDSEEEREREKERDRSSSKRARRVSPARGQVSKGESLKRSSSERRSPRFWERERSRREEERYARDLRHGSDEPHSLRRPEQRREDSRRGSFQHEKDERLYREPRRGDGRRTRIEERERLVRNERYDGRPRSPRSSRDRMDRRGRIVKSGHLERDRVEDRQPSRERQPLERGGRHVGRERRSHERERHRHKKRSHKDQVEEMSLEKSRKETKKETSESGSESDATPEGRKGEQESIEELIKEIQESDSSDESSESSMEEDVKVVEEEEEEEGEEGEEEKSGGSSGNESDSEESMSEGAGSKQEEEKRTKRLRKMKARSAHLVDGSKVSSKESGLQDIGEPLIRSKFDDDDEDEEENDRQQHKWYSGYHEVLSEEGSGASDIDDLEGGGANEGANAEVEAEPERSPTPDLPCYYPALMGCRSVENYEWLNRIEEGTYGVVYRAKDRRNGEIVALKKLKMEKEKEGFPITSLREINMLLKAKHPNIVHVREIVVGNNMDKIYIVMDYVEHDLKALMETMQTNFLEGEVKTLMIQLLRAVHHLHDNWILHRDLKASNLLLSHKGILKVGDFGLAREYGSPLKQYTPVVVTLWYRPPELLLGAKEYSTAVDMWSVGCIFAEFMLRKPLFRGKGEIDQLNQIFKELGTPSEEIWPGYSQLPAVQKVTFTKQPYNHLRKRFTYLTNSGFDLLNRFLTYDPKKRISARDALDHPYFKESPLPVPPHMFPTWPAKSEMSRKPKREKSPTPPEGGAFLLNKRGDDDDSPSGIGRFRMTHAQHGQAAVGAGFSLKF